MRKGFFSLTVLSLVTPLSLLATRVRADFLIKFVGSGQVTVRNYVEEGQTIKVYTPQGVISFRKDEVSSITELNVNRSMSVPLETVSAVSGPSAEASAPGVSENQKTANSDKTLKSEGRNTTGTVSTAAATLEQLDGEYQGVKQEFDRLWEKHVQDMNSGASEEVLTENRNRLTQLSEEQHKLIKDARRAAPDDLPVWAR